jgi:hypothetical protein
MELQEQGERLREVCEAPGEIFRKIQGTIASLITALHIASAVVAA